MDQHGIGQLIDLRLRGATDEMGHNFINVGEEYDGGQVYRGVNSASSVNNVGWTHWLSDPANVKEESADILLSEYPW